MAGLIINVQDAKPLASVLGISVESLDTFDGQRDGKVSVDVIQNVFPNRLIVDEFLVQDYGWSFGGDRDSKPVKTEKHWLCFIDNGDGYISTGDLVLHVGPNGHFPDTGLVVSHSVFSKDTHYFGDEPVDTIGWKYAGVEIEPILQRVRRSLSYYNRSSWLSMLFGCADGTNSFESLKTYFSPIRCEMRTLAVPGSSLHRACSL